MTDKERDKALREMAKGAGLRLVKSRRRKPGIGDYGRYGLKTPEGQPCFGFADDGLTATPEEIEDFLQERARKRWRQSIAAVKPLARRAKGTSKAPEPAAPKPAPPPPRPAAPTKAAQPKKPPPPRTEPEPPPAEPPKLQLRNATNSDVPAIARLVGQLGLDTPEKDIARLLRSAKRKHEAPIVAELGELVGCVAFHVIPALHHGASVGRITMLVVDLGHRREGIGTKLIEEAEATLSKKGCTAFEIVNEIEYSNASGFLRERGYEQRSYRHSKTAASDQGAS